ncbi:hypothetical protein BEH94_02775 [Candidatus Altiarchaeales archaeon WOR_SM1_SCG]|nr:hypothetical protein BEH94_02775 [Candidatus Altiarchaeales archaeon WOR_SM1_SCG]
MGIKMNPSIKKNYKNIWFLSLILIAVLIFLTCFIGGSNKEPETGSPDPVDATVEKEEYENADCYFNSFESALESDGGDSWINELWNEITLETSKFESGEIKSSPKVQKEAARIAFDVIKREIRYKEDVFDLSGVLETKKANCMSYSQVYWIICKKLGLDAGVVYVYGDKNNKYSK